MAQIKRFFNFCKDKYKLLARKKYTTLAGTLVFFLIMSIVPLSFWITLLIGKLPIDTQRILSLPVFDSVKNVLSYVQQEAATATTSVSIVLVITTLYSSTTFFYQMRRSGEIIYDYRRPKKGLRVRAGAFILWTMVMALLLIFLLLFALGAFLFSNILPNAWQKTADYILLTILSFGLVLLLNMYVCPYKTNIKQFLSGTFVTVGAWALALIGFSIYIKIGNLNRLYGALSTIIVFLLWLYVLMICFIGGVILNSEKITKKRQKERKYKRKKKIEQT